MDITDRISQALSPRYDGFEEIGRGGSSTVFRASDTHHGRVVAVKVLDPRLTTSTSLDRFEREIRIAATLNHPNVLPLYDSGEADGLRYYTMPFVEGESLRDRIRRDGPLPIEDAIRLATEVADGLSHAHAKQLIHRDIKPGNILLDGDRAVLADFGIARPFDRNEDRLTSSGFAPGTPTYMSPEHAGAEELDARSDLYSLGCVLYESLTGEPPFTGRTAQAVVARHMYDDPRPLTVVRPAVPPAVADVVDKLLQKVPVDRYQSAAELSEALDTVGVHVPPKETDARGWPRRALLAAAIVAAVAVGTFVGPLLRPPALDEDVVVVFPLAVSESRAAQLGWDAALAIGTALEHTEPLRWIDGWHFLSQAEREDPSLVTADVMRDIAREQGAGSYLAGVIHGASPTAVVTVRLHDTRSSGVVAQESEPASSDSDAAASALAATVALLPELIAPGMPIDTYELKNRVPAAIALAVQGDRAYREARFGEAVGYFRDAVSLDPAFALAAARGAVTALWAMQHQDAQELARAAAEHTAHLPRKQQHLVRAVRDYVEGRPDIALSTLDSALAARPGWPEAHAIRGEIFFHLFPAGPGGTDAAEVAFRSAAEDPTFVPPLYHLAEIEIATGSMAAARRTLDALSHRAPDDSRTARLETMYSCVEEGAGYDWSEALEANPAAVLTAGQRLSAGGRQIGCGEAAFRTVFESTDPRVQPFRWMALLGLQSTLLAQGRVDETVQLLQTALDTGIRGAYSLYLFDAHLSESFDPGARVADEISRDFFGPAYDGAKPLDLWLIGSWAATRGTPELAGVLAARLDSLAPIGSEREARLLGPALSAHASLADGNAGAAASVLAELRPTTPLWNVDWKLHESLPIERIVEARIHLAAGDYESAIRAAEVFDHPGPVVHLAYLGPSLMIRHEAALGLGRDQEAEEYGSRLDALGWDRTRFRLTPSGSFLY